jgi:hypothetical protein
MRSRFWPRFSKLARWGGACSWVESRFSSTSRARTATSSSSRRFSCTLGGSGRRGCCRPARSSFAAASSRSRLMETSLAGAAGRTSGLGFAAFGPGDRSPNRCLCRRRREISSRTPYPKPKPKPTMAKRMRRSSISSSRIALPRRSYLNNCGKELTATGSTRTNNGMPNPPGTIAPPAGANGHVGDARLVRWTGLHRVRLKTEGRRITRTASAPA